MRKIHTLALQTLASRTEKKMDGGNYSTLRTDVRLDNGEWMEAFVLRHYATPIVVLIGDRCILNASRYSLTTSALQRAAREFFPRRVEVGGFERGVSVGRIVLSANV